MENRDNDKIMNEIFAYSKMEMGKPGLADDIVKKILKNKKQKAVINYIISCALLIIVSAVMVMLSIPAQQPATGNVTTGLNILGVNVFVTVIDTGNWFRENMYFIIPVIMLFLFKKLIDIKFKQVYK